MSARLASFAALAFLWLTVALLVSIAARAGWPALARTSRARHPQTRARLAFLTAFAPLAIPTSVVLLCALPGIFGLLTGAGDHCAGHGEHPHFCPVHATLSMTPLLGVGLAVVACVALAGVARTIVEMRSLAREQRWLDRRRMGELEPGVQLVAGETPIALTSGLYKPKIWIARTLFDALDETDLAVVLAHERAHAARRDPARFLAAFLASALHFPRIRADLLEALQLATEQSCDVVAAERAGVDGLRVAETLLRVERLMQRAPRRVSLTAALVDTSLPARIEALVALAAPTPDSERSLRWPWLVALGALLLASPVHHLAEHALEALLRSMVGLQLLS